MEAIRSSETSVHTRSTRRHIPEDGILLQYLFETFCSNVYLSIYVRDIVGAHAERRVKCLLLVFLFNQNWNISANFDETPQYQIL
jgi:hypothetical protein